MSKQVNRSLKDKAGAKPLYEHPPQEHTQGETYADKHGELRRLREVRGLGTRSMAAEIGISPATLNRAENGETVSVEVAAKIGPYIGKCLCCDQLIGSAPPENHTAATYTQAECDEMCEIAKRDGYEEAVQDIDQKTGGDGEYRYCLGMEDDIRHQPDAATMIQRIVDRYEVLNLLDEASKTGSDQPDDQSPETNMLPDIDTVARAISSRYPSGDGSKEGEAWYWAERHDHPANDFAHESRDEDRQIAKAVMAVLSPPSPQTRARG